ncbi:hypothetical protein [Enterobacter roggenkampii]|uniref:hypothetical protein n=1 Tax=Enterobacter roggenkampii TaxID=1812935 RepID=UPI0013F410E6|nr:hypothetical protein [Enterobacter roggenkampii]EMB4293164.1 hypothetical protein [Enterobacter roggenkampii]HAT7704830.1 hypothetical protein [Enterobacter roggenkampii]
MDESENTKARLSRLSAKALRAASQNKQTILGVIFNLCVTFKKQSDSTLRFNLQTNES